MSRDFLKEPLNEKDIENFKKEKHKNEKIYTRKEEFVFIHKTNYAPLNNQIKSRYQVGAVYKRVMNLYNEEFNYFCPQGDDYLHFSLNCEVRGENEDIYGFNRKKYAIIIPGSKELFEEIAFFHANDVEFKGIKDISNSYILCPIKELEEVKGRNKNSIVIPYIGKYVDGYAEVFASYLGFNVEEIDIPECMWINDNEDRTNIVLKKYGFSFIPFGMDRYKSEWLIQRMLEYKTFMNTLLNQALNRNINIFKVINDIENILNDNLMNSSKEYFNNVDIITNNEKEKEF